MTTWRFLRKSLADFLKAWVSVYMIKKTLHTLKFNWCIKRTRKFNWNFVPKYFIFDKEEPEVRFYDQGQENLMHKVRICPPNTWTICNENLGFAQPAFWPYFIDCAPNLRKVLPPLLLSGKNLKSYLYQYIAKKLKMNLGICCQKFHH